MHSKSSRKDWIEDPHPEGISVFRIFKPNRFDPDNAAAIANASTSDTSDAVVATGPII